MVIVFLNIFDYILNLFYLGNSYENKNTFSVFRTDVKSEKVVITANSCEEKVSWMELLNDCIAQTGFI